MCGARRHTLIPSHYFSACWNRSTSVSLKVREDKDHKKVCGIKYYQFPVLLGYKYVEETS